MICKTVITTKMFGNRPLQDVLIYSHTDLEIISPEKPSNPGVPKARDIQTEVTE